LTSNEETIKKYRKMLTPRNGNSTWASARRTESGNDPRSLITYICGHGWYCHGGV
jgi:hypothetical protein